MFKFLFVWKHRKKVEEYIRENYVPPKSRNGGGLTGSLGGGRIGQAFNSDIRFALSDDYAIDHEPQEAEEPKASETPRKDSGSGVLYSDRDSGVVDRFDFARVSEAIEGYLSDTAPLGEMRNMANLTFVDVLRRYIRERDLEEPTVYKAAQIDRRLFSKIISNREYKPSKDTALALVIALRLSVEDCRDLLERAGYALSHSLRRDIIIEYFIKQGIYKLDHINAVLYELKERVIGRSV